MELAGKVLGFLASALALGLVLLFAWTARAWATAQIVKALREELKYVQDQLAESDGEVRGLRLKEKEHEEKITDLEARYLSMEALERSRRAYAFTLDHQAKTRERYIKRLETLCLEKGFKLPDREDGEAG